MELNNTFKFLSAITDPDLVLKNLLILEEYNISNFFQSPNFLKSPLPNYTSRLVPKTFLKTLQLRIENDPQTYSAVLREGEKFTFGKKNCDIYIECDKVLSFTNNAGLIYASQDSAHLICRSINLNEGMEFEYLNMIYKVERIWNEMIQISLGGISKEISHTWNILKEFGLIGKLKAYRINDGWAIRSNSCEKLKIISGTVERRFFVACGEEVEFNLKIYRVWYKLV